MTSVLFVHGTGGRTPHLAEPFRRIRRALLERRPDLRVERCLWGDHTGARLNANGKSIPAYHPPREDQDDVDAIALWSELYEDPSYELRLLAIAPPRRRGIDLGAIPAGDALRRRLRDLTPSAPLAELLDAGGIAHVFGNAIAAVSESEPFRDAMRAAGEPLGPYTAAVARAVIATAIAISEERDSVRIATDGPLRDLVVEALDGALGDDEHPLVKILTAPLEGVAASLVARYTTRQMSAITDATSPFVADIIRYQARGAPMREFIRARVAELEPPVVLLAHSLGGIMCVDMLVESPVPGVELLATIGSQAPFFYEVDALSSLPFGEPLPAHFPRWVNVYDLSDILSYEGRRIFPGRVEDVEVSSRQPFPRSHLAYWDNPATWDAVVPRLP